MLDELVDGVYKDEERLVVPDAFFVEDVDIFVLVDEVFELVEEVEELDILL